MSALSRTKGAAFERKVANMLTDATGTAWKRRVRNHQGDSDVVAESSVFDHLSIECKHAAVVCLPAWWRQAQAQAGENRMPVLVYKRSGSVGQLVVLDAHDVNSRHWPVRGRHIVTLDWDAAMQWMREMLPAKATFCPGIY